MYRCGKRFPVNKLGGASIPVVPNRLTSCAEGLRAVLIILFAPQERNIILSNSFEYRFPTPSAIEAAAAKETESWDKTSGNKSATVKVNMTNRLIGLIVIPGIHITKIELE